MKICKYTKIFITSCLWLCLTFPVLAHHSFSVFNIEVETTIEGEMVELEWTNPHTWAWVNVTNEDGSVTKWGLEGMSPNYLGRRGWSRKTLQAGDKVTFVIYPLRSGEPGGMMLRATLADGKELSMFGG
jgi:hypothetical protein